MEEINCRPAAASAAVSSSSTRSDVRLHLPLLPFLSLQLVLKYLRRVITHRFPIPTQLGGWGGGGGGGGGGEGGEILDRKLYKKRTL